jgi:hypothetical protein
VCIPESTSGYHNRVKKKELRKHNLIVRRITPVSENKNYAGVAENTSANKEHRERQLKQPIRNEKKGFSLHWQPHPQTDKLTHTKKKTGFFFFAHLRVCLLVNGCTCFFKPIGLLSVNHLSCFLLQRMWVAVEPNPVPRFCITPYSPPPF